MNININYEDPSFQNDTYEQVIEQVCQEAALVYGLGPNAEISVLLCHNEYIHELNKQYRQIDRPTDVLSFALNEGEDDGYDGPDAALLGDIVISLEKVQEQAEEYGHSAQYRNGFALEFAGIGIVDNILEFGDSDDYRVDPP